MRKIEPRYDSEQLAQHPGCVGLKIIFFAWIGMAAIAGVLYLGELIFGSEKETATVPKSGTVVTAPSRPAPPPFVRPATGPDGQPWPRSAAYIAGMPRLNTGGLSSVTVDNSQCTNDVLVKVYSYGMQAPVRVGFIPAGGRFTFDSLKAGKYDVRYQDLDDGSLARSETFDLQERRTYSGTEYSTIELTLYKVRNGNMQTYPLSPADF
jgi:hypothetical protein